MKIIDPNQLQILLQSINRKAPFGERDYHMLRLLANTGLRVAEIVGLDLADVWHGGQPRSVLFVRPAIAKGHHGRSIPLCQTAREAIAGLVAFLSARGFSTAPDAPLLVVRQHRRISIRLVQQIVQQLRQLAGLDVPATPHSMRHYFATQLVERTQDVVATSRLLGHYVACTLRLRVSSMRRGVLRPISVVICICYEQTPRPDPTGYRPALQAIS